jgi:predicted nuclease of predicted toxin-antitoxin system
VKVLLDSCISGRAKGELETSGHDVAWCGDWARDPGDEEILRTAHAEGRVLVTLGKDFGELVVKLRRHAPRRPTYLDRSRELGRRTRRPQSQP